MAVFLTTSEIARMYGLADSTVRHYRSSGRLVPSRKTPGGHARYAVSDVVSVLGEPGGGPADVMGSSRDARVIGMERERFAPAGQHDLRSSAPWGVLSPEVAALGRREAQDAFVSRDAGLPRWGGRLLRARSGVAA
jgi:MerR family regulatory protein